MKGKLLVLLLTAIGVYGCSTSCQCYKYGGCAILKVRKKTGYTGSDTVLMVQRYCARPGIDFYLDTALRDSALAFQKKYSTDTSYVDRLDSTYLVDGALHLKGDALGTYERNGYNCACAK